VRKIFYSEEEPVPIPHGDLGVVATVLDRLPQLLAPFEVPVVGGAVEKVLAVDADHRVEEVERKAVARREGRWVCMKKKFSGNFFGFEPIAAILTHVGACADGFTHDFRPIHAQPVDLVLSKISLQHLHIDPHHIVAVVLPENALRAVEAPHEAALVLVVLGLCLVLDRALDFGALFEALGTGRVVYPHDGKVAALARMRYGLLYDGAVDEHVGR
jgi:hypothetical protein